MERVFLRISRGIWRNEVSKFAPTVMKTRSVNGSNHIRRFYVLDRSFLDEGEDSEMDMMMAVQITNGMIKG